MRNRAHENSGWCVANPPAHCRPQHRLQKRYISPYHESPIDLEKYDDEMNTTETTDKSNTKHVGAACWPGDYEWCEINKVKKKQYKNGRLPSRPLATGCAANFEIFGGNRPSTTALLD
ncbi:hypothetical protein E0Z10_g3065 [Xylaria hypoxylon]|uniref:Uncharacterized protein n=1 Tax=Xylaria hypoxylon TaxID=37992 RepID=A0A4Z0Z4H8_9PEZI|nr:hypothetical protein E0Z10_g3065 [Xylaria hypoxylon]